MFLNVLTNHKKRGMSIEILQYFKYLQGDFGVWSIVKSQIKSGVGIFRIYFPPKHIGEQG
jgi:hypothetical protein